MMIYHHLCINLRLLFVYIMLLLIGPPKCTLLSSGMNWTFHLTALVLYVSLEPGKEGEWRYLVTYSHFNDTKDRKENLRDPSDLFS